jgi:hypothetical protein
MVVSGVLGHYLHIALINGVEVNVKFIDEANSADDDDDDTKQVLEIVFGFR